MEQKTQRFYPFAPLENIDLEQKLERKVNDVNGFNISIDDIKGLITFFKDKNHTSKKKLKRYKKCQPEYENP